MIEIEDILLRRKGEQGSNVSKNSFPEHGSTVGVIIADQDFIDPTQYIINKTEVFGVMEADHVRIRKLLSVAEFMTKSTNDIFKENLKSLVPEKEELFVLEEDPFKVDNSKISFILDLSSFEWKTSEPAALKFSEQISINNL